MDTSLGVDKLAPDSLLITLSCRFIPYDQWLITHVDPSWKVKHVKLWLLGKCLGVTLHTPNIGNAGTNRNVAPAHSNTAGVNAGGSGATAPTHAPRYRPASPITFAPDPRSRPISPIFFAKSGSKVNGRSRKTTKASGETRGVHGGKGHGVDGDSIGGYEEDDEWDTADDEGADEAADGGSATYLKRSAPGTDLPNPNSLSPPPSQPPGAENGLPPSPSAASKYNTNTSTYTLLRFSTGQRLEDEFQLSWYELAPNELLELHAHAPVQHLPPSFELPNSTRNTSKSGQFQKSAQHARTNSTSSLSRQPSRPYANPQTNRPEPQPSLPTRRYFPTLNRASPASYVQPYWEGYVRALRVVWHENPTYRYPHPAFGYGGGLGQAPVDGYVPATAVMGQDPLGRDLRALEMKEGGFSGYGAGYAEMNGNRDRARARPRTTRLEWRLRWAVVRDGMLYLSKDRDDEAPAQAYPLAALTSLRGADHLASSSYFTQGQTEKNRKNQPPKKSGNKSQHTTHHHRAPSSGHGPGHRLASSTDGRYTRHRDRVQDLDSDSDRDEKLAGVRMSELEGDDLKIVCIRFKAGGKVRGPYVPPTTEPRNPKKYSSTIGYGALLAQGGESSGGGGLDGYGFGMSSYVTVGSGAASASQGPGVDKGKGRRDKEKEKEKEKKKDKDKDKRGPYLRKSSLPSLGIAEGSRTFVNLLGREKERESAKLTKAPQKGKEKSKDWISALANVGSKSNRDRDKNFGIPGMKKGKGKQVDKAKVKDAFHAAPPASMTGFGYFDAGPVDEQDEDPNAEVEGVLDRATVAEEESEGESDDEGNPEADQDLDGDADNAVRSDSPYSEPHPPPTTRITRPSHLQKEAVNLNSDSEASLVLSSPVFRRGVGSSGEEGMDDLGSDNGKKGSAYRYGYRYGYDHLDGIETKIGKEGNRGFEGHGRKEGVVKEQLPLRDRHGAAKLKDKTPLDKDHDGGRGGYDEVELDTEREKSKEKAEWIVLDMGTDPAYSSLLRILHRHFPAPLSSSFVSALPRFSTPSPASTPTPTPTPFPSPISLRPMKSASPQSGRSSPTFPSDEGDDISYASHATEEETTTKSTSSRYSSPNVAAPHHPRALGALSQHTELALHKTFGALAYPEWRTEVVERAQRAGMGDVGGALRWVLWQCDSQLERDLQDVQNQKNEDVHGDNVQKRRGAVGNRGSRKYRRSIVGTAISAIGSGVGLHPSSDSDTSDEIGKLISGSGSEDESSEAEWHGWMADLFRQQKVQARTKRALEEAKIAAVQQCLAFEENDLAEEPPRTPAEDRRHLLERRMALEPIGIVTTRTTHSSTPPSSSVLSTPSRTLYSPSSSESLAHHQRVRTLSFSPEAASGPSSSHGHSLSRSISPFPDPQKSGPGLSHSTSMYTGLRSTSVTTEQSLRRPSMPTLTTEHAYSSSSGLSPCVPVMRTLTPGTPSSVYTFPPGQAATSSSPPQFSSPFTGEALSSPWSSGTKSSPGSVAVRGRTTSNSLGRSSNIFGRSNSLLRRDADKLREREREEKRAKEKEGKSRDMERLREQQKFHPTTAKDASHKHQRPKLSVATPSSSQHAGLQVEPQSSQPVRKPKPSIMRRVRSGSSLKSPEEGQEPVSPTDGGFGKKKKGVLVDRIVRGLDSALEFVDGK